MKGFRGEDVIILCGGLGTRLRAVLPDQPKPMALVGGKPFLERLIDHAAGQGFKRFILCLGYKADAIREYFRGRNCGREIIFSQETLALGTAGALKLCEPLRRSEVSLVMNGDSFCELDLTALLDFHADRGGAGTIVLAAAGGRQDGGFVLLGEGQRIVSFSEKRAVSGCISAGIYALDGRVFAAIPEGEPRSLEEHVFPALIGRLYGHLVAKPLYDIGTPERLERFRRNFP